MGSSAKRLRDLFDAESDIEWIGDVDRFHFLSAIEKLNGILFDNKDKGDNSREVLLHISSGGGDIDVAWTFYDHIRTRGVKLLTLASGNVESAAVLIFLAGKERYASRDSEFLIHDITIMLPEDTRASTRDTKKFDKQISSVHNRYLGALARETGLSIKELDRISEEALPISPKRAKELGIVHHII